MRDIAPTDAPRAAIVIGSGLPGWSGAPASLLRESIAMIDMRLRTAELPELAQATADKHTLRHALIITRMHP